MNGPVHGCAGCATTAGRSGCSDHRDYVIGRVEFAPARPYQPPPSTGSTAFVAEIAALRRQRDALLAALRELSMASDFAGDPCWCGDIARNPPIDPPHVRECVQARAALALAEDQP